MRSAHTVETVRTAEHALIARLPEGALMRRAAHGLAAVCARLLPRVYGARVVLLAGTGDNGGDALYAGAALARRGAAVTAVLAGPKAHAGGLGALRAAGGRALDAAEGGAAADAVIGAADLVVDGLLGIGGRGGLREPYAALAGAAARGGAPVVAVDLPSGVDADTGAVGGAAVRADVTVTFGTYKPALFVDPAAELAGAVEFIDIGLGPELPGSAAECPQAVDVAALLPEPAAESDKYRRGVLSVLAGSQRYRGAGVLTVGGALRTGIGMVRYAGHDSAVTQVLQRWPEAVGTVLDPADPLARLPERVGAHVVGPGRGLHPAAVVELETVLSGDRPVLVDADALTILGKGRGHLVRERAAPTLLTPHAGELARLLPGTERSDIEAHRLEHAARAAEEYRCTVLLKGSTTVIAQPGAPAVVNPTGSPLLAAAGTGDVLAGVVGALMAGGLGVREAAMCGTYLHGRAAALAHGGAAISASDLVAALPAAVHAVRREAARA